MSFALRPYQINDIHTISVALKGGNRVLYRLPTGGGKTVIFTHIAKAMAAADKRVLILTHRQTLVRQTAFKLSQAAVRHGIIAAGFSESLIAKVQIASVQSLKNRLGRIGDRWKDDVSLIIVDEAHHTISNSFLTILNRFTGAGAKLLGVTATPSRLDGVALNPPYDALIIGAGETELIAGGYLSDYAFYLPPDMHDPLYNRTRRAEVTRAEALAAEAVEERTGDAVGLYNTHLQGKRAIAFCYSIADSERVASAFNQAGITAKAVSSKQKPIDINIALRSYEKGTIRVLCTCDLISEGFDVPETTGILMMRKTESLTVYLQQIGRAMRPKDGGERAILIDMVNNIGRHGLPDDVREWTLDGDKKVERGASVKRCIFCYAVSGAHAKVCRSCGREFPTKDETDLRKSAHYSHDGVAEFAEVDKDEWRRLAKLNKRDLDEYVRNAKTLEDVKKIAAARGYAAGWVNHVMWAKESEARGKS